MVCPWPCDLTSSSLIFLTYKVETSYFLSTSSLWQLDSPRSPSCGWHSREASSPSEDHPVSFLHVLSTSQTSSFPTICSLPLPSWLLPPTWCLSHPAPPPRGASLWLSQLRTAHHLWNGCGAHTSLCPSLASFHPASMDNPRPQPTPSLPAMGLFLTEPHLLSQLYSGTPGGWTMSCIPLRLAQPVSAP